MAEMMTPNGLVVGLILDQADPKPAETEKEERPVKKTGRTSKK